MLCDAFANATRPDDDEGKPCKRCVFFDAAKRAPEIFWVPARGNTEPMLSRVFSSEDREQYLRGEIDPVGGCLSTVYLLLTPHLLLSFLLNVQDFFLGADCNLVGLTRHVSCDSSPTAHAKERAGRDHVQQHEGHHWQSGSHSSRKEA